ncbi:hypothetical protein CDAR_544971 [Caerostris darwini]|uniref:Uncharacterized protein n=1 Tax=Caerostris darwini TaxID=1538125 RepID=A0AAV4PVI5_9ARAC|nr:hypothetical protein CDAR_544971 [Caerostris darwini]
MKRISVPVMLHNYGYTRQDDIINSGKREQPPSYNHFKLQFVPHRNLVQPLTTLPPPPCSNGRNCPTTTPGSGYKCSVRAGFTPTEDGLVRVVSSGSFDHYGPWHLVRLSCPWTINGLLRSGMGSGLILVAGLWVHETFKG